MPSSKETLSGFASLDEAMAAKKTSGNKTGTIYKFECAAATYYILASSRYQAADVALQLLFRDMSETYQLKLVSRNELIEAAIG